MGVLAAWCLRPCPKGVTEARRPGNACHSLRLGHALKAAPGPWVNTGRQTARANKAGRLSVSPTAIAGHGGNGGDGGPRALTSTAGLLTAMCFSTRMSFWPIRS